MYKHLRHGILLPRFDSLEIGTREQYEWLLSIVKTLILLNLLDAIFTLWWVGSGAAVEANALLEDLVIEHPLRFVLAKLMLVSLGAVFLWRLRHHRLAVIAIFGAFFVYYLVLLHHLRFWSGPVEYTIAAQNFYLLGYPVRFLTREEDRPEVSSPADPGQS